ncbi:hypothetical protein D3C80_1256320 [compost metagenome]
MAEQGQLQAHSIVAGGLAAIGDRCQAGIAVAGDNFSGESSHGVFTQMANQLLSFSCFGALGGWLLGWTDFLQVAFQCHFQGHALGAATLDVNASDHFVFGAACPVFGVAFCTEGFGVGRPACFAHQSFPGAGSRFDEGGHDFSTPKARRCAALY